jgi:hypothetical protein
MELVFKTRSVGVEELEADLGRLSERRKWSRKSGDPDTAPPTLRNIPREAPGEESDRRRVQSGRHRDVIGRWPGLVVGYLIASSDAWALATERRSRAPARSEMEPCNAPDGNRRIRPTSGGVRPLGQYSYVATRSRDDAVYGFTVACPRRRTRGQGWASQTTKGDPTAAPLRIGGDHGNCG